LARQHDLGVDGHRFVSSEVMADERRRELRSGRQVGENSALVVSAVEVRGKGSGRVGLQVVPDASGPTLTGFVCANVSPDATTLTDGWLPYNLRELAFLNAGRRNPPRRSQSGAAEFRIVGLPFMNRRCGCGVCGTAAQVSPQHRFAGRRQASPGVSSTGRTRA
jgi:ISXO2-like transposase domain